MEKEEPHLRRSLTLGISLAILLAGWLGWRNYSSHSDPAREAPEIIIEKRPPVFAQHSFDPAAPPPDMPPLGEGEEAECDSNFVSNATVSGTLRKMDATTATVTVTQVKIALQLRINIWVPQGAAQHVIDHEQGHREISEHYYQNSDQVARQIAASYLGRQVVISGSDLNAEFSKALLKMSSDITAEYNDKLTPGPAQQRYDDLTDHSRNYVPAKDAVAQALKEIDNPAGQAK
jgi:hypothetical protein